MSGLMEIIYKSCRYLLFLYEDIYSPGVFWQIIGILVRGMSNTDIYRIDCELCALLGQAIETNGKSLMSRFLPILDHAFFTTNKVENIKRFDI